jgi:hypothetical protein
MSTSRYSKAHADVTSPSRTDDYPEIPAAECRSSRYCRPAQHDVGSQTIRIPLPIHYSASRRLRRTRALWLFVAGLALTLVDGIALAMWADLPVESVIIAALSMLAGIFVTAVAVTLVKL